MLTQSRRWRGGSRCKGGKETVRRRGPRPLGGRSVRKSCLRKRSGFGRRTPHKKRGLEQAGLASKGILWQKSRAVCERERRFGRKERSFWGVWMSLLSKKKNQRRFSLRSNGLRRVPASHPAKKNGTPSGKKNVTKLFSLGFLLFSPERANSTRRREEESTGSKGAALRLARL